jgi:hypothetical protein
MQVPSVPQSNIREDRVRDTLHSLVRLFESGQAPEAIAVSALPRPSIPSSKWSLSNNLLLWIAGTGDARGFRQWQEVRRHVRQGAKAIYILAPRLARSKSRKDTDAIVSASAETQGHTGQHTGPDHPISLHGAATRRQNGRVVTCVDCHPRRDNSSVPANDGAIAHPLVLAGFLAVPVFRFEDTDGEPLQHDLTPPASPPLTDVAQAWGLTVRYVGYSGPYLGYYRHNADRPHEITLATHDEQVFFHELAHAAQYRTWTDLKPGQKLRKEVAAELAACALARLCGRKSANEGHTYQYIKHYCDQENKPLDRTLWGLVSDTEAILRAILNAKSQAQAA